MNDHVLVHHVTDDEAEQTTRALRKDTVTEEQQQQNVHLTIIYTVYTHRILNFS